MIDKKFEWNIDGIQANTVLEGAEVNIPIEKYLYSYIFCNDDILNEFKYFDYSLSQIFDSKNGTLTREISSKFTLSYLIKNNKYCFSFDYNTIFNNILEMLKMNGSIKSTKITNIDEYNVFVKEVKKEIKEQCHVKYELNIGEKWDDCEIPVVKNLYSEIEKLLTYMIKFEKFINNFAATQIREEKELRSIKKPLTKVEHKSVKWKNLMYYTSCKALDIYEKTGDKRYYKYAKNYYLNVSRDKKVEYPEGFVFNGYWMDNQYNAFNSEFLTMQRKYFSGLDVRLGIEDLDTYYASLTEGNRENSNNTTENGTPKKRIDYTKNASVQRKIVFYRGLKSNLQGIIKEPLSSDANYIGFVLNNNYVIYDKFYDLAKNDYRPKPSFNNAVYVVTLDVAVACHFDKGEIREYIEKNHDFKAFRLYHNETDSYQGRINEVIGYNDVSTIKYRELKLLKEKRD